MTEKDKAAQGSAATAKQAPRFSQMGFAQKVKFVGKVVVCLMSFGFVFPNIFSD